MTMTLRTSKPIRVPKVLGADTEFANYIDGTRSNRGTAREAVRLLLDEVDGPPCGPSYVRSRRSGAVGSTTDLSATWTDDVIDAIVYGTTSTSFAQGSQTYVDPRDVGRRFQSSNGGCIYEDMTHYEACLPEVWHAKDFTAATQATFVRARQAAQAASAHLPPDQRVVVLATNTDGRVSWGSHLNVLTTRPTFESIVDKVFPDGLFLGSYLASAIVFAGQGRVGAANGRPAVDFQLSARADFIESLMAERTTWRRPLVNTRSEPLCGRSIDTAHLARLHIITFDHNLQQVACYLKAGVTQVVVAMIEAGVSPRSLILEDPVAACWRWSHDPELTTAATTVDGRRVTIVEHQMALAEAATRFVESGGCDGLVPEAPDIVGRWIETLEWLQNGDHRLATRLDWVLKYALIRRALDQNPDLTWHSDEARLLDSLYGSVDEDGLYFACCANVESVIPDEHIARLGAEPPDNTRAWSRAMLLRAADRHGWDVVNVDWDEVTVRFRNGCGHYVTKVVRMADPIRMGRAETGHIFDRDDHATLLDSLGGETVPHDVRHDQSVRPGD